MSEWEDRIQQILGDPEQMAQISQMAQSLMGGGGGEQTEGGGPGDLGGLGALGDLGIDPGMLGRITRLLREDQSGDDHKRALLAAMRPYLSEKRREKLDRAMKLARLSHLAKLAMGEDGGHV